MILYKRRYIKNIPQYALMFHYYFFFLSPSSNNCFIYDQIMAKKLLSTVSKMNLFTMNLFTENILCIPIRLLFTLSEKNNVTRLFTTCSWKKYPPFPFEKSKLFWIDHCRKINGTGKKSQKSRLIFIAGLFTFNKLISF